MHRTILTGLASVALALSTAGTARPARAGFAYTLTDLGAGPFPAGSGSKGVGVNDAGQVVGRSGDYAFLSGPDGGPLKDLGTLGGSFTLSIGEAINASGQVVGSSYAFGGTSHAFLFSGRQMLDLNCLIAPGSGFTLQYANGISDTGNITGYGVAPNGATRAFLLTKAVPEPSRVMLLGTGTVGLLLCAARQRPRPRA